MEITTNTQMDEYMEAVKQAVEVGIRGYLEREYERAKEELLKRLEKEKDAVISGTMLNFARHIEMHTLGTKLIVEIAKSEP